MELDNFERKIAEKLDSFDPQLPIDDWSTIEARLSHSNKKSAIPLFINTLRNKISIAASIAIIIGLSISILFITNNNKTTTDDNNIIANSDIHKDNNTDSTNKEINNIVDNNLLAQNTHQTNKSKNLSRNNKEKTTISIAEDTNSEPKRAIIESNEETTVVSQKNNVDKEEYNITKKEETKQKTLSQDEAENLMQQINQAEEAKVINSNEKEKRLMPKPKIDVRLLASLNPVEDNSSEILDVQPLMMSPSSTSSAFNAAQKSSTEITSNHKLPYTLGMQIGFGLTEKIAIHTGIEYTGLHSDYTTTIGEMNNYTVEQQRLNYIGIPVKFSFTLWSNKWIDIYTSAGGKADWLVYGDVERNVYNCDGLLLNNNRKNKIDNKIPPLLSLNANIGTSIKLYKYIKFYIEPSYTYYIVGDKNQHPNSHITNSPHNFIVEAGIRFDF